MDNLNIKLFNTDSGDVALPNVSAEVVSEQQSMRSKNIEKEIGGSQVKKLIIPEDSEIDSSNIIFDFSEIESISIMQKEALKGLVSSKGDATIYLYRKNSLVKVGYGKRHILERLIPMIKEQIFGSEVRVFKDFEVGKTPIELSKKDITKLRMNL